MSCPPAIDLFSEKNRELPDSEMEGVLTGFGLDLNRPIVVQVSRFDRLKDPLGVIEGFCMARRHGDAQLVLAGGAAPDDPEGGAVLEQVMEKRAGNPDIFVLDLPPDSDGAWVAAGRRGNGVAQKPSLAPGKAQSGSIRRRE